MIRIPAVRAACTLAVLFVLAVPVWGAAFTPGNLVVYRQGDGAAALANTGTPVFLDEYTVGGALVQSIAVPVTTVGAQRRLVCSGTATSEGYLTRSADGQYVVFTGYDAAVGTASITGSTSATVPRVIGRVAANGTIDTSTALTDAISGGNPRSAASTNGTDLWISGTSAGGGIRYATLGATTSTSLAASPTNLRALGIFGGQLYVSASTTTFHLMTVGTGTPTTGGQTLTNLPGFPTTGSQYGFFFADLTAAVAGMDTLYVADDGGTINKYSLVGGNWTANGSVALASARGLTGTVSSGNVTLYVTARSTLRTLTDTSGYNATITGSLTTLATAATNTAMQGVAFVPQTAALPTLTVTDVTQTETNAGTTTFTFTVSLSSTVHGGVTFDIATADGTAQDDNPAAEDNDYVAQSLTGQTIPNGSDTYQFNVTVNGDVVPEGNETFFVNVTNVAGATVTDGQGQGTITNDDASCADLTINDVSQAETDAGTTTFAFTVGLSQAGCGAVTFDIATQDNTATTANNDYVGQSLTGQTLTFPSTYTFNVTVNGDVTVEPNQSFFVNITNVSPANVTVLDPQGVGTIVNDDFTRIHDIQGPGASSPLAGSVTTRGIVTGVKGNGYFIQEPDASVDADPATSEGVFVFTNSAPPAAAAVGNYVEVTGTISEFIPSQDPLSAPLTELTSPTTVQLSTGNPLPATVPLTATFPDPAGPFDQLERVEGMRVSVASLTVAAPTLGNVSEANATSTSTGVFFGVVTGVARPSREPGIQAPDPAPSGTIPPIPRWDSNPETIRVDSDGQTGATAVNVSSSATVTGLVGPLDYSFRRYTILPDPSTPPGVAGGKTATSATAMTGREFTVASYNMERFFDTVNDPGIGEPVLTATAFNNRLNKASLGIRNNLGMPDILGVIEVENLTTLQALAATISSDAVAASQPDPSYVAYLVEGNDVGGIDVGFLVKTAVVAGSTPRVTVNAVVQELDGTLFVNPDSSTETLNDRPPLRLDAVVADPNGATFPITVIVVHQRSLNDVNNEAAGSNGWPTTGARVRAKRQKQAEDLANLIQARQTATPGETIVVLGDFNAYEFNDGLADTMDTVTGTPPPDNETAVPGDGIDLVNPDLDNLFDTPPPGERYSYLFDGQTQNIDHLLVNQPLISATAARRIEHPRINSDFPETDRNDPSTARRLSDHDPVVGFFEVAAFASAEVSLTKTDSPDPVTAGTNLTYTITVTNAGPDAAGTAAWSDVLPAGTTFVSLAPTGAWSCTTPAVGANGTVSCSNPSFAVGSDFFTLVVNVSSSLTNGTVLSNTATFTSPTSDPTPGNESATATTTVTVPDADVSITKSLDTAGPYFVGQTVTYTLVVANAGPAAATNIQVTDTPANLTITNVSSTSCSALPCTIPSMAAAGSESITVTATITAVGAFDNSGTVSATQTDSNSANNTDNTGNGGVAAASADVFVSKTLNTAGPFYAGQSVSYTIRVQNNGPSTATSIQVTDTPTNLTLTSVQSTACSAFPCTIPTLPAGSWEDIAVIATIDAAGAFDNSATATAAEFDPTPGNNTDNTGNGSEASTLADVRVSKFLTTTAPYNVGQTVSYTIDVTNDGPSTATTVQVTDTPTNLTITNVSGACTAFPCTIASMASGATVSITVTATINAVGVFDNSATATAADSDPNPSNNTDNVDNAGTTGNAADVSVSKSIVTPAPYHQGDSVQFQIVVSNAGPNAATSVSVTDTPANLSITGVTGAGCTSFPCTIPSLGVGSSATITVTATIQNPGAFDNASTVSAAEFDPVTSNNSDPFGNGGVADNTVDVAITKTLNTPGPWVAGQSVSYTLVVSNAGPGVATLVQVTDTPANLTITSVSGAGCTAFPCTLIPGVTPTPASNRTITVVGTINGPGPFDNSATATQRSGDYDPNPANNTDNSGNGGVAGVGPYFATKTVSGSLVAGTDVTYTVILTNNLGLPLADNPGNEFADVLPPSLTLVSANATSGTVLANVASNTVTWNGPLANGAGVTITIVAQISATASGTVSNQGTALVDMDNNGTNETTVMTNDPGTTAPDDPTVFTVGSNTNTDTDGDGVLDPVEQAAPNGGDGNGDGIADYLQSTVASIPAATGTGYLTLQSTCPLTQVGVTTEEAQTAQDSAYQYPHGLIYFRAACSSASFSLFVHGSGAAGVYRKFGPLPPGGPVQWYTLPGATFGTATVGSVTVRRIDFSLTDGGTGDDTPVDGIIVDQGGPAAPFDIPTLSWEMLALLASILGAAAMWKMRS